MRGERLSIPGVSKLDVAELCVFEFAYSLLVIFGPGDDFQRMIGYPLVVIIVGVVWRYADSPVQDDLTTPL